MVWTAVRDYHIYKDVWTCTIGEEFVAKGGAAFSQTADIYLVRLFFLEHDGCIIGNSECS